MTTPDILKKIITVKTQEIAQQSKLTTITQLTENIQSIPATRGFTAAIQQQLTQQQPAIIAEIKKASPSKGILRHDFSVAAISQEYAQAGASCLSVLTDRQFFQGSNDYIAIAKTHCQLPVLRKDFIIDPYQIYQARAIGADCILLIVAALDFALLAELAALANELTLDVLIEVHNQAELELALPLKQPLIGINNRNLHNFTTDLQTSIELAKQIPQSTIIVTESGIHNRQHIDQMKQHGINCFLIGEALMKAKSPGAKLTELFFN